MTMCVIGRSAQIAENILRKPGTDKSGFQISAQAAARICEVKTMDKIYIEWRDICRCIDRICDTVEDADFDGIKGMFIQAPAIRVEKESDIRPVVFCKDCAKAKTDTVDGTIYCRAWELRISSSVYMWEMPEKGFCYKGVKKKCGDVE